MNTFKKIMRTGIGFGIALAVFSCDTTSTNDTNYVEATEQTAEANGTIKVELTDAPLPIEAVRSVYVVIEQVDAKEAGTASESWKILSKNEQKFDLLRLTNGITDVLAIDKVAYGNYDDLRIHIKEAWVKLDNGKTFHLDVPAEAQYGVSATATNPITVDEKGSSPMLIDFMVNRSVHPVYMSADSTKIVDFTFTPVLRVVNMDKAGKIGGEVRDARDKPAAMAKVWVEQDGKPVVETYSDELGNYALIGIPEGNYILKAYKPGKGTFVVDEFKVQAGVLATENVDLSR